MILAEKKGYFKVWEKISRWL